MSLKECPSCGVDIEKVNTVCPICGYEFPANKWSIKWVAILMIILFAWPIFKLILNFFR